MNYTFKIFKEEDGSYFMKIKERPECISVGNTLLDTEEMILDIINPNRGFSFSFKDSIGTIESLDYEKVSFLDDYEKDVSNLRSTFEKFLLSNDKHYFVKTRRGILIEIDGVLITRDGEVIGSLDLYPEEVYEILKGILLK